jgi:hypothetical protein
VWRTRRGALRCRFVAQAIRRWFPSGGEFERTAPNSVSALHRSFPIAIAASNESGSRSSHRSARFRSRSIRTCAPDRGAAHNVRPRFRKRCEVYRLQALNLGAALPREKWNIPSQMQSFKQRIGDLMPIGPLLPLGMLIHANESGKSSKFVTFGKQGTRSPRGRNAVHSGVYLGEGRTRRLKPSVWCSYLQRDRLRESHAVRTGATKKKNRRLFPLKNKDWHPKRGFRGNLTFYIYSVVILC